MISSQQPLFFAQALRAVRPLDERRVSLLLLLLPALLRLVVAPLPELGVDEAHYALYGLHPALSYFDHPPLVGWLQAVALFIGESPLVLRLWAIALSTLSAWLLYRLTAELFPRPGESVALVALAAFQLPVMLTLLGLALVPETPLITAALASALYLRRAVEEGGRGRDWLLLGLLFGLAGLAKYTAITLVATALLYLLLRRRLHLLLTPWPWLAALLALLVISPVLWWNYQHDFISFHYQLNHGAPDRPWSWSNLLRAQGIQLAVYTPAIFLLAWIVPLVALARGEWRQPGAALSIALGLPVLLLIAWGAGREDGLPHWAALGFTGLLPLIAHYIVVRWRLRWLRWLVRGSLVYAGLLLVVVFSNLLYPWLPFRPYRHPLGDLIGWREAAVVARQLRDEVAPNAPIFVGHWTLASRIAWYARPAAVQVTDDRIDQFDLWFGSPLPGASGVLVVPDYYQNKPAAGLDRFGYCEQRREYTATLHGDTPVHTFRFYACYGYHG